MSKNRIVEAKIPIDDLDQNLVIEAFVKLEHMEKWWDVSKCLIELKPGGLYCLVWQENSSGFNFVSTGMVRSFQPSKHLILDRMVYMNPQRSLLGPMSLNIQIQDDGSTPWLKIKQKGYQEGPDWDWYYEAVRVGWPQALNNLEDYLLRLTKT